MDQSVIIKDTDMESRVSTIEIAYETAAITVQCYEWLAPDKPQVEAARLRLEITAATGVQKELFLWERHTVFADNTAQNKDRFMCVAKVSDLSVYPVGDPDNSSDIPPFYRLNVLDVPFSSPDDYISTFELTKRSLYSLIKTLVELKLTDEYPQ